MGPSSVSPGQPFCQAPEPTPATAEQARPATMSGSAAASPAATPAAARGRVVDFVTMNIGAGDWGRQGNFSKDIKKDFARIVRVFKNKAALCWNIVRSRSTGLPCSSPIPSVAVAVAVAVSVAVAVAVVGCCR